MLENSLMCYKNDGKYRPVIYIADQQASSRGESDLSIHKLGKYMTI